jgi:hypothetical protein
MTYSLNRLKIALVAGTLAFCLTPSIGWSTRVYESLAAQVTSVLGGGAIAVGSRTYSIKPGSAADKMLSKLSTGQQVHAVLDGPPADPKTRVIALTVDRAKENSP